jgi:hypothetical protein
MPGDAIPFRDYIPAQTDLNRIREWAIREGMVLDSDQLISEETIELISRFFTSDDSLSIAVSITPSQPNSSACTYLEYPLVPVAALVKREVEVEVVYWAMEPDS